MRSSSGRRLREFGRLFLGHRLHVGIGGHRLGILQFTLGLAPRAFTASTQRAEVGIFLRGRDELVRIERAGRRAAACSSAWRVTIWFEFRAEATSSDLRSSARGAAARRAAPRAGSPLSRSLSWATPLASSSSPDDQGRARVELVGPLHAPLHVAAIILLDGDALPCARRARCRAPWLSAAAPSGAMTTGRGNGVGSLHSIISRSMPPAQPMPAVGGPPSSAISPS